MNGPVGSNIEVRVQMLWDTMPTASRRRTHRGRFRALRQLTEHLERARQLESSAQSEADRRAVDGLVGEIERRRDELSGRGMLVARVQAERKERRERRIDGQLAQFAELLRQMAAQKNS